MRRPGRRRRQLQRLLGNHHGGDRIVGALRLDEQAAQAEQPRILALGHGAEDALRAVAIAVELRRLRVQQQRQRIVRGMFARDFGMRARGDGIAVSDRQQSLRDGVPAAGVTPLAAAASDIARHSPQAAQNRPEHHRRDDDDAEHQHEHRQRGLDAQAAPGQHEVAGLLGDPGRTRGTERDQQQKQNDPDHRNPYCAGLASTAMASAAN